MISFSTPLLCAKSCATKAVGSGKAVGFIPIPGVRDFRAVGRELAERPRPYRRHQQEAGATGSATA
jgi:hypothetical protein